MLGTACTVRLVAVVAMNTTFRVAAGTPPGPVAVMMAGPAEVGEIAAVAVPKALVATGLPATVPRVDEKVTSDPTTGTPAFVQLTAMGVAAVDKSISVAAAGAVKAKLALLTVSA